MNKTELINTIAQRTDQPRTQVEAVLNEFLNVVGEVVAKGDQKVSIPGWISFEQTERSARTGRNPQTGETINVPAKKTVKISAGATLKNLAAGGK